VLVGLPTPKPTTPDELLPPRLAASLDRLDLLSRKILAGKLPGERRSKRRGRSVEFDDFRAYQPGDDPRHIDWNVLARLDRLVVKLFREEEDLSLSIAVDVSASMDAGQPNKLVYALQLAASLAYLGLVNHNRVSVTTFGAPPGDSAPQGRRILAPRRGRSATRAVTTFLLEALRRSPGASAPAASFADSLRAIGAASTSRGVLVIISDFLEPEDPAPALSYLAPTQEAPRDTYCLQLLSPGELDPARDQPLGLLGDLRLTDAETLRHQDVTITPQTIARFQAAFAAQRDALRAACARRGLAYVLVPSDTPIESLLTATLRRSGMLR